MEPARLLETNNEKAHFHSYFNSEIQTVCHPQAIQQTLRLQPDPSSLAGYLQGHHYVTIMFSCHCAQEVSSRGYRLLAVLTRGIVSFEM